MFGRRKEEWDYIEAYFDEYEYGKPITEVENQSKNYMLYLKDRFRPHLDDDEPLLCVIGNGRAKDDKAPESAVGKKVKIAGGAVLILGMVGFFSSFIIPLITENVNLLLLFGSIVMIPIGAIGALIGFIMTHTGRKRPVYALTDRRVIILTEDVWQEYRYDSVVNTNIMMTSENTGKIVLTMYRYDPRDTQHNFIIPNVYSPLRVKAILDEAIYKYRMQESPE